MTNHLRGEMAVTVNGQAWVLCLTLGALAEIESHFGVADLPALGTRLSEGRLATHDIVAIICAAARGGGMNINKDDILKLPAESTLSALSNATLELFIRTFPADPKSPENP